MSDKRNGERGATAVFIAAALLVLMALVSLAVDGGLGFNERRGTQNAADLAALAAAWEDCNPETSTSTPELAARDVADQNGYLHNAGGYPTVDVASPGSGVWTVTITEQNETTFGRATPNAPDQITVASQATARCIESGPLDGYAVFGESTGCSGFDVDLSGANIQVDGGVHSNEDLKITGSNPSVSGDVTWRGTANLAAGVSGVEYFGGPLPYPSPLDTLSISEYAPGGSRAVAAGSNYHSVALHMGRPELTNPANGWATESGPNITITAPGIYYAPGNIVINKNIRLAGAAAAQGVTFIAGGRIDLSGFENAKGYDPLIPGGTLPVFLYANGEGTTNCTAKDIKISANSSTWEGVMFAPHGAIEVSGSTVGSLNGSLIGYKVTVSASNFTISYTTDSTTDPEYKVELVG